MKSPVLLATVAALSISLSVSCSSRTSDPKRTAKFHFSDFPVGVERTLSLDGADPFLDNLSAREQRDQVRDWILYAAVYSSEQSAAQISRILFDLPPVRADYLRPVARFCSGSVRSAYLGDGEVLVVVPQRAESDFQDDIAEAADDQRKNIGRVPTWLHVFRYTIKPGIGAVVKRAEPLEARQLYTPQSGYRELPVRGAQDLRSLLLSIDKLTFASLDAQGLRAGGRRVNARKYRGIDFQNAAELFQADRRQRAGDIAVTQLEDRFKEQWGTIPSSTKEEESRLLAQAKAAGKELDAKVAEIRAAEGKRYASCGFSLDPYPAGSNPLYQAAAYICDLKGTATGMTLFYTDLLAKLWAFNFEHSIPRFIPDFVPVTETKVAAIHRAQMEQFPWTRIWFGPRPNGFQSTDTAILFAPAATRVFARSSKSGVAGKDEVEATGASTQFMNWWNDHFEEIALWEPEYQRLNEVMKWSVLFRWLAVHHESNRLSFLDDVPLSRALWFPDWVKTRPDLRFTAWDRIEFFARGENPAKDGTSAETMQILKSAAFQRFGQTWTMSGGISLASDADIRGKTPLTDAVPDFNRRDGIDHGKSDANLLTNTDGVQYRHLGGPESATVTALPPARDSFAGSETQVGGNDIATTFDRSETGLTATVRVGGENTSAVELARNPGGFGILRSNWATNEAIPLLRTLSEAPSGTDLPALILNRPGVRTTIVAPDGNGYFVGIQGETRWLHVQTDTTPATHPRQGQMKYAGSGAYRAEWLSGSEVLKALGPAHALSYEHSDTAAGGTRIVPLYDAALRMEDGATIPRSERDGTISLHRARDGLPADSFEPGSLEERIPSPEIGKLLERSVKDGDHLSVADRIAGDRNLVPRLSRILDRSLETSSEAFNRGDYLAALDALKPWTGRSFADPRAAIAAATSELMLGRPQDAIRIAEASSGRVLANVAGVERTYYDLLDRASPEMRPSVERVAESILLGDYASRHSAEGVTTRLEESNGQLRLFMQLSSGVKMRSSSLSKAGRVEAQFQEVETPPAPDWLSPFARSLDSLPPKSSGPMFVSVSPILARLPPDVFELVDGKTRRTFVLVWKSADGSPTPRRLKRPDTPCKQCSDRIVIFAKGRADGETQPEGK